ncbi:hypothetical protein GCM10022225_41540 [Plantactinospora mayteni]|uniref:Uncharacterized protein n=1 Tax=Plantactinospora mayteni TaxID=566021 RepID=A0ABQ4EU45_9ACTN|nr:hypothetical protein [Plantactinospora mayteni]GIG98178.1 hypothetical protein Pma05_47510 [Plantactinospora mayteni]
MGWDERVPELLTRLGELGLVGAIKIDGERAYKPWTVVISGQQLGGASIRYDGDSLDHCLRDAVAALRERYPDDLSLS